MVLVFFTDNYFDVTPEQPVSLIFETTTEIDDIVGKLKTYSLYDSQSIRYQDIGHKFFENGIPRFHTILK